MQPSESLSFTGGSARRSTTVLMPWYSQTIPAPSRFLVMLCALSRVSLQTYLCGIGLTARGGVSLWASRPLFWLFSYTALFRPLAVSLMGAEANDPIPDEEDMGTLELKLGIRMSLTLLSASQLTSCSTASATTHICTFIIARAWLPAIRQTVDCRSSEVGAECNQGCCCEISIKHYQPYQGSSF